LLLSAVLRGIAAADIECWPCSDRLISPVRRAHSSKPAAAEYDWQ